MKIKMVRHSGRPVELEQLESYENEFKSRYDEIIAELGNDMREVHTTLEMLDNELSDKYDTIMEIERPRSAKQEKQIVKDYGHYMVSTMDGSDELIYVILDQGL